MDSVDIFISNKPNDQYAPKTVSGEDNFFVIWQDTRYKDILGDCNEAIYGTYVTSNGNVLDTNGILLTSLLSDSKSSAIIKSTGNRFLLCYSNFTESPYGSYRIYGKFIEALIGIDEAKNDLSFIDKLEQNFPNPFIKSTVIRYQVREKGSVKISIFNVTGQLVKRLVNEQMNPGTYIVQWDGMNNNGKIVGNGIYFYTLQTKDFSMTKKMILIK
mgnify:CR=1 FL=1